MILSYLVASYVKQAESGPFRRLIKIRNHDARAPVALDARTKRAYSRVYNNDLIDDDLLLEVYFRSKLIYWV